MTSYVRIALAGMGSFAVLDIVEGDTIGHLSERACVKFPSWKADSAQLSLYLVAAEGDDTPPPSAVDSARHLDQIGWSLARAKIASGAWLVARKIADVAGASLSGGGGGGGGGGGVDIAAALESLAVSQQSLAEAQRAIIQMLSQPDGATVLSDPEYEDQARHKLPAILLSRCGLEVARGADVSRAGLGGRSGTSARLCSFPRRRRTPMASPMSLRFSRASRPTCAPRQWRRAT